MLPLKTVPLTNQLHDFDKTDPKRFVLAKKFCTSGHCITKNGISNLAVIDQDGNKPDTPNAPFKVTLVPTGEVQFSEDQPASMAAFMAGFTSIPVGSKLYEFRVHMNPDDKDGTKLGHMVTIDKCVTSHFGDTKMQFKHQGIEEDVAMNPQWSEAYYKECYCNTP